MKEFNTRVTPHNDDLESLVEYYEALLDHLDDMIPCLDELIESFDDSYGGRE